ncbi:SDR family oxidoreductase [Pseudomonas sp. RTC3]|uniref:dTDP-4-dehydrorhamnose reductase family protein n=1 Tax=unclassified Pseudomonas TaxID=196821 RepID=UPI002AB39D87|nr:MULTISPECIES: SDR family oxidoreductase [unclassified Pseudomonas]MEB0064161.1 SDR family oxidoreductase [Pseudomonas sp. RTC3]MDY7565982.1 SDR family oxidoreductase [Pseudomonas sp. 5C2]MEB0007619.1 SDR family oxidoreductase [Pseudomonas sp. RTB2]MEB0018846.1 SDR family oxidoreductase [Pseudomonas sp. RTB3]MEB0239332.1 SDR family oxidoreductase [Pseudomonas sp. 5C2]
MNILILGVTGMLGSTMFKYISENTSHSVRGTMRNRSGLKNFKSELKDSFYVDVDVLDHDSIISVFDAARPDLVINCVGLIKQLADAKNPLSALPINAMLPHRLSKLCGLVNSKLIHISTDCIFSGRKGMYTENDISDAEDLYGKSKYIGEISDQPHVLTLRTSIIGHELGSSSSLIDWFLSQTGTVKGYSKAIFSGLPTVEVARVIVDFVIPNPELCGLYHLSVEPIDKYSLLREVAKVYEKNVEIIPDDELLIDRSLDSSRFRSAVGYMPPSWPDLIKTMYLHR